MSSRSDPFMNTIHFLTYFFSANCSILVPSVHSRNFMLLIDAIISVVIDKKSNAKLLICKTHLAIQKISLRFDKL